MFGGTGGRRAILYRGACTLYARRPPRRPIACRGQAARLPVVPRPPARPPRAGGGERNDHTPQFCLAATSHSPQQLPRKCPWPRQPPGLADPALRAQEALRLEKHRARMARTLAAAALLGLAAPTAAVVCAHLPHETLAQKTHLVFQRVVAAIPERVGFELQPMSLKSLSPYFFWFPRKKNTEPASLLSKHTKQTTTMPAVWTGTCRSPLPEALPL